MLQTFETVTTQDGWVKFNEPFTLDYSVKASVTFLPDAPIESSNPLLGEILLQLLESTPFSLATWGDSEILEQQVQTSRNAWISDERVLEIKKSHGNYLIEHIRTGGL